MSSTADPDHASDQALVAVSFNPGESLAQEFPTELVCMMAKFLIVQSVFQPQQPTSSTNEHCLRNLKGLLTATQVCRKWRNSILNDARLWTEIDFTVQRARDVEAFNRVLSLSKRLPLHMRIDFGEPSSASDAALYAVWTVWSRCASLYLKMPHELYVNLVNERPWLPILRRLSFTPIGDTSSKVINKDSGTLWDCFPALEFLQIPLVKGSSWLPPYPRRTLKTLEIGAMSDPELRCTNMFVTLLEKSKTLSNVIFAASYLARQEWDAPGLMTNTSGSLKTLRLKRDAFRILPNICLPGLNSLWIDTLKKNAFRPAGDALSFLVTFLDRSNSPLKTFTLGSSADVILDKMPSILPSMPHLQTFHLYVDMDDEHGYLTDFFDTLARNDNGAFAVLPKLRTLMIHFFAVSKRSETAADAVIEEVDRDHFVEMVRARTAYPKSPLRLVEVIVRRNGSCNLEESDLGVLKKYERRVRGLKVVIQDARRRDV